MSVNGTRLWFDVEGAGVVPDGPVMRERPTIVLVHGGPGSYDHSYFKPYFARLAEHMQVVYLDLRQHGRSARGDLDDWTFEACADDVRSFCETVGIERPVVLGHSFGGCIAMLYGVRHPRHVGALVLQSTMARLDLERLVDGFRQLAGDDVADLARRDYGGHPVTDEQWDAVFSAFGPHVPDSEELGRRIGNPKLGLRGMELFRRFDVVDHLDRITCPTLVCVGVLDAVTPVAAAQEIIAGLAPDIGELSVIEGAGHFPWLDRPDRYWDILTTFVMAATAQERSTPRLKVLDGRDEPPDRL